MLHARWLEIADRFAACPAVHGEDGVVTFAGLAERVARQPLARGPVVARSGGVEFFVAILAAWRDGQAVIPVERDAPAPQLARPPEPENRLVKHTPGAAGVPRGIFFTAEQVAADADRLVAAMALDPAVPNLAAISLAHSYGFSSIVLPLLLHGVPVHLAPVPFPRVVEEILRSHPALVVPAVPSMWRAWHRAGILGGGRIRLAVSAGAPLSLELEHEVHAKAGLKIHNFYGASECGGISWDSTTHPRSSADNVGTPFSGVTVELDEDGRIAVASTAVAGGYDAPRPDDALGAGRYRTRDLGFLDAAGHLRLTGTLGGAINVAGRKVSPAKVEAALLATGLVRRIQVRGVPSADPERCEEISAEVELAADASLGGLKRAAAGALQSWELPRHWRIVQ